MNNFDSYMTPPALLAHADSSETDSLSQQILLLSRPPLTALLSCTLLLSVHRVKAYIISQAEATQCA